MIRKKTVKSAQPSVPVAPIPSDPKPGLRTMWTDNLGRTATRSIQIIAVLLLAVALVYALINLKVVVIPVIIALILASALHPLIAFMRKRGVPSIVATWVALVLAIVVIGGVVTLIVFAVQNQWPSLVKSAEDGVNQVQNWLQTTNLPIDQAHLQDLQKTATDFLTSSQFGSGALAGVTVVGEIATAVALGVVVLFFFLKDGPEMWAFLIKPLSPHNHQRFERIGSRSVSVFGGYVRGTAIVALVDAVGIGIVLSILQIPLAIPLAVIVFIGAFIPIVGATVAGILAALVALVTNGLWAAVWVVVAVVGVNQLEGNFLQPIVMGKSLKLHPLVILIALAAGTILGGIIGAILSVPIAAVAWAIIKTWNENDVPGSHLPAISRRKDA
ncbi:AI-2E family transporter [Leifsonia sp. ALI-44-B]|uniref:AI-2E family transporter n=1 Tax=Leifsonia sp. ALI-44-B TaxID=1933776 RepID=UPI00117ACD52|nr:AI-2E family transporter [Leifsonia sp. ALI-44-B]